MPDNEPKEVKPYETGGDLAPSTDQRHRTPAAQAEVDLSNARTVHPFKIINRGEDSVFGEEVTFSDFSPKVLPADAPDEQIPLPKDESAPAPAPSSESVQTTVPQTSDSTVQTPAAKEDGQNESGSQTSS